MKLHHLAIVVADLARAERFWCGVVGLGVRQRWDDERGPRAIWLDLGPDAFLALERAGAPAPRRSDEAPGIHCIALAIEPQQRDALRARLAAAGHPVERESPFTLYVRDADGNLVGFSHHPHALDDAGTQKAR